MVKMESDNNKRTRRITLRLTPGEYELLERKWKETTCRKLSGYLRSVIFGEPVVKVYRNRSMDDLIGELTRLRRELNHVGHNFNQVTKKLHTIDEATALKAWLISYEVQRKTLFSKMDSINQQVAKIAQEWLRLSSRGMR